MLCDTSATVTSSTRTRALRLKHAPTFVSRRGVAQLHLRATLSVSKSQRQCQVATACWQLCTHPASQLSRTKRAHALSCMHLHAIAGRVLLLREQNTENKHPHLHQLFLKFHRDYVPMISYLISVAAVCVVLTASRAAERGRGEGNLLASIEPWSPALNCSTCPHGLCPQQCIRNRPYPPLLPHGPGSYAMNRSTIAGAYNMSGLYDAHLAARFGAVFFDADNARSIWLSSIRNGSSRQIGLPSSEELLAEQCRLVKQVNPHTRCLVYRNAALGLQWSVRAATPVAFALATATNAHGSPRLYTMHAGVDRSTPF